MLQIPSIVTNYDAATSDYSEGKFRDNPGDSTGSGVMAAMANDLWYAAAAVIKKYRTGGKSSIAESESSSDLLTALEEMIGAQTNGISAWSASTTYPSIGTQVMRFGIPFISIYNASTNLNMDPITHPLFWMPVPTARDLLSDYMGGRIISGGSHPIHDYNNAAYVQYFSLGQHKIGGGDDGQVFTAYGVHLDGSNVGASTLSTIIETWHLKDTWAPGSTGSRVLVDAKGRLLRAIDETGGQADLIGEVLEDQVQGHLHETGGQNVGTFGTGSSRVRGAYSATGTNTCALSDVPITDGTNGTPRTGLTTRDKSITVGVPYAIICVPAA
jgi:hypothetical protein